ncbi:hypothetical protein M438DRAFT_10164 [Aureobasidium pullulans EXF-150]|uniref:Uncharacterized protein n=1 Tax=Aureobasidium pullulans EXF-150 TaxID=1043002 RepID=A0A074XVK2_AURPU|nr:uncharacterized protein M438DRAFT_10164 [Aureobasidium pullulans EXF-150]KEQ89603.1 hypothetical protein M438DRAFT_10164 [Aureobasidium pullulans EXF-150]
MVSWCPVSGQTCLVVCISTDASGHRSKEHGLCSYRLGRFRCSKVLLVPSLFVVKSAFVECVDALTIVLHTLILFTSGAVEA